VERKGGFCEVYNEFRRIQQFKKKKKKGLVEIAAGF
jgi:hypothetical protein